MSMGTIEEQNFEDRLRGLSILAMIKRGDEAFLIEKAIKAGAFVDSNCIDEAVSRDSFEILEVLKDELNYKTEDLTKDAETSIEKGYFQSAYFFVKYGADVNANNKCIFKMVLNKHKDGWNDNWYIKLLREVMKKLETN